MRRIALALAIGLLGCQPQAFIASPGDYAAYRATRVGATFEDRLAAAQRYLVDHADGRFKGEVRAYFDPAEEAFWKMKKDSKSGLRAYLDALPAGPHQQEAERRLTAIDVAERSTRSELDRSAAAAAERVSGRAADERTHVQKELEGWLGRWLDRAAFAAPLSAAKKDLVVPFALSLPAPRCTLLDRPEGAVARRCVKLLELPFTVEADRAFEEHQATLEIALAQDARGVPIEVSLGGPDLFLRLEETYRVRALSPADTALRAAAQSRALNLVKAVFARAVSEDPACRHRPVPPTLLELSCEGVRVSVGAGASPGQDDRIVIRPAL